MKKRGASFNICIPLQMFSRGLCNFIFDFECAEWTREFSFVSNAQMEKTVAVIFHRWRKDLFPEALCPLSARISIH